MGDVSGRIESLQREHMSLDGQVKDASRGPAPDSLLITSLKRRKLEVKDELAALKALTTSK